MGAVMAKRCKGRRQISLEVGFEIGWSGRDAVGRAYERLLPSLARASVLGAQGSRGACHEESTPKDCAISGIAGGGHLRPGVKTLERSRRGKRHRAQAGAVSALSRAPYGYRYVTREAGGGAARYDIDEDAASIVRKIFAWVGHERLTLAGVCRRLRAINVPSPSGNAHWSVP
jgi:hypothetical protein